MKVELIKVLKPYKVKVPKREMRKPKSMYEVHFEDNNSLYTDELLSNLKTINFSNGKFKEVTNPSTEVIEKLEKIFNQAQCNNIVLTSAIRCNKLYDNLSNTYILVAMRIPKLDKIKAEITGYDYRIAVMTGEGYESQLGQFCKMALIMGGDFVYKLIKQYSLVNNLKFVIFTNSKNNRSLMNSSELKTLYADNFKSVQNKKLYYQLYLCKTSLTNCGYRFIDGNIVKEIISDLQASR